jgi:hypothetical protein
MGRPAAADIPVRGGQRAAASNPALVGPEGLGHPAHEAGRAKKAKVAVARKIAVILHCIWTDGTSFE